MVLLLHLYDLYVGSVFDIDGGGSKELNNKKYGNNKYDRILSAMDVWIGKILDNIDLSNTLVVLTADHATERGDYDSNLEEYASSCQKIRTSWKPNPIYRSVTAKKILKILQRLSCCFNILGPPSKLVNFHVINVTAVSIIVQLIRGFTGGFKQIFIIRYSDV